MSDPNGGSPRTPLALALNYDSGTAPRVVAKGRGTLAERIIETGRANGVVIEENPLLAEALSAVELDAEIPPELYRAVAEVISFVLKARARLEAANRSRSQ
jgi:flagellar biosynthesis protein